VVVAAVVLRGITEQILAVAEAVAKAGAKIMRAGRLSRAAHPTASRNGEKGLQLNARSRRQIWSFRRQRGDGRFANPNDEHLRRSFKVAPAHAKYFLLRALGEVQKPVLLSAACPPPSRNSCSARNRFWREKLQRYPLRARIRTF